MTLAITQEETTQEIIQEAMTLETLQTEIVQALTHLEEMTQARAQEARTQEIALTEHLAYCQTLVSQEQRAILMSNLS